jgi:hypothetical protein
MSFDFEMSDLERENFKALSAGSVRAVDLEIILEGDFRCDLRDSKTARRSRALHVSLQINTSTGLHASFAFT